MPPRPRGRRENEADDVNDDAEVAGAAEALGAARGDAVGVDGENMSVSTKGGTLVVEDEAGMNGSAHAAAASTNGAAVVAMDTVVAQQGTVAMQASTAPAAPSGPPVIQLTNPGGAVQARPRLGSTTRFQSLIVRRIRQCFQLENLLF